MKGAPEAVVEGDGLPRVAPRLPEPWVAGLTTSALDFGAGAPGGAAARRALRDWAWPRFGLLVGATQVHGTRLFQADGLALPEPDPAGPATVRLSDYDGFLTATPGVLLTVGVADCIPALLVAPEAGAAALLHAGWRGTAAGIVERGVAALGAAYGAAPAALRAWWGPAIGPCCYPVGEEVVEAIRASGAGPGTDGWVVSGADGSGWRVDLRAALSRQAAAAGIPSAAVASSPRCTACDPGLHSYRRARGGGGRMMAIAGRPRAPRS